MTIHVEANTGPHSQVKEGMGVRFSCAGGKGVVINICLRSQQSNQYFYSLHIEVPKNSWACSLLYPRPLVPCSPPLVLPPALKDHVQNIKRKSNSQYSGKPGTNASKRNNGELCKNS